MDLDQMDVLRRESIDTALKIGNVLADHVARAAEDLKRAARNDQHPADAVLDAAAALKDLSLKE